MSRFENAQLNFFGEQPLFIRPTGPMIIQICPVLTEPPACVCTHTSVCNTLDLQPSGPVHAACRITAVRRSRGGAWYLAHYGAIISHWSRGSSPERYFCWNISGSEAQQKISRDDLGHFLNENGSTSLLCCWHFEPISDSRYINHLEGYFKQVVSLYLLM